MSNSADNKTQKCYLCHSQKYFIRSGSVRDNSNIKIHECSDCGLVYLSSLNHLSDNHYQKSGMHKNNQPDIKAWIKDTQDDDERRFLFLKKQLKKKSVLDFGCGAGGFMEIAQQLASSVAGIELEEALQSSFKKRKLNVFANIKIALKSHRQWELITAFHVIEHLIDPIDKLKELSGLLVNGGELIIEVPNSDDALLTLYKCSSFQKFTYWSQHLFLFNATTLADLINQAGLRLNWIKQIQRYPLSNHLYWLANEKPGGHKQWDILNNKQLNLEYEKQLATIGKTDTIIASCS